MCSVAQHVALHVASNGRHCVMDVHVLWAVASGRSLLQLLYRLYALDFAPATWIPVKGLSDKSYQLPVNLPVLQAAAPVTAAHAGSALSYACHIYRRGYWTGTCSSCTSMHCQFLCGHKFLINITLRWTLGVVDVFSAGASTEVLAKQAGSLSFKVARVCMQVAGCFPCRFLQWLCRQFSRIDAALLPS